MDVALTSWLEHSPATYSAWVAGIALVVTATAAVVALLQLRNALEVRREQARPSVVAFDEVSPRSDFAIDFVLRNYGSTVARNVRVTSEPPLRRAANMTPVNTDVPLPLVPTLAPGQEWRTTWDWTIARLAPDATHGLPDRHEVTVRFEDSKGRSLSTDSVLDFSVYRGRRHLGIKTLSDLAKTVADIEKHLRGFSESVGNHAGVRVWVRDGATKDAEERAWFAQMEAEEEAERQAQEHEEASSVDADPSPVDDDGGSSSQGTEAR